jgi:hypothetical protein
MKNQIIFIDINGKKIPRLRGGRPCDIIKDKTKYNRKRKYKHGNTNQSD